MIRCNVCGVVMNHDWQGHYDKETGKFTCNGCYSPDDIEEADIPPDGVQEEWKHPELDYDAYDATDRTAKHTDIGEVE